MTKLVTMSGKAKRTGADLRFSLFSMAGKPEEKKSALEKVDPRQLSDIDAGIWFLSLVAKENPGITFGELFEQAKLSGWWTDLKKSTKAVTRSVGNTFSDVSGWVGRNTGDAIRLLTDEQVVNGVMQYGAAYASGGASMGLQGMLQGQGGGGGLMDTLGGLLGGFGQSAKVNYAAAGGSAAGMPKEYLLYGGIGLAALLILMMAMK